jgi:hypothetical protein
VGLPFDPPRKLIELYFLMGANLIMLARESLLHPTYHSYPFGCRGKPKSIEKE